MKEKVVISRRPVKGLEDKEVLCKGRKLEISHEKENEDSPQNIIRRHVNCGGAFNKVCVCAQTQSRKTSSRQSRPQVSSSAFRHTVLQIYLVSAKPSFFSL